VKELEKVKNITICIENIYLSIDHLNDAEDLICDLCIPHQSPEVRCLSQQEISERQMIWCRISSARLSSNYLQSNALLSELLPELPEKNTLHLCNSVFDCLKTSILCNSVFKVSVHKLEEHIQRLNTMKKRSN